MRRTGALTVDYHGLQRCIRNEQQGNQRQADHCKKKRQLGIVPTAATSMMAMLMAIGPTGAGVRRICGWLCCQRRSLCAWPNNYGYAYDNNLEIGVHAL